MRAALGAALAAAVAIAVPGTAGAQTAVSQPECPDGPVEVRTFKAGGPPVSDWRENLVFDGLGGLWISNNGTDRVERYAPDGTMTLSFAVPGVAGLARGPDGLIYVGSAPGEGETMVLRFDPSAREPSPVTFASGTTGANGMTFDPAGNLYTSNDLEPGIGKVRPDGTIDREWTAKADVWGPNGLVVVGDALFVPITFDQRSPIERVPLADPAAHTTLVQLSFGTLSLEPALRPGYLGAPLVPKGVDDLAAAPDGRLYVTAYLTGELLSVDSRTGFACVVASGLGFPTSADFAEGFGSFDPRRDLFVTEASGNVSHVRLPAPGAGAGGDERLLASSRLTPGSIRNRARCAGRCLRPARALLRIASRGSGEMRLVFSRRSGSTFVATSRRGGYALRAGKRSIVVRAGRLRAGRYTVGLQTRRERAGRWRLERTHRLTVAAR